MNDFVEVKEGLTDTIGTCQTINEGLDNLSELMQEIDTSLSSNEWTGESKEKCQFIHETVKIYYDAIQSLCEEMEKHCKNLIDNTDSFVGDSENVQMLQSI
ncbi:hypothetical protein [Enterococcus sp. BWR-S5]|uniref:hypothetical protein n=1 Tax=Enterococcus sp. BWR-S5 TaxID=2787714 RepID=UPI0019224860|nr:hypothetical protein [Enterococcus sp. BWR-S5]MBL1223662.1 hypothetical protein [Enterococcus sp. BWR-S5]